MYAVRVRGTKLRFYRADYDEEYLSTLATNGAPKGVATFTRYPGAMAVNDGLDLLNKEQRHVALRYLASLRKARQPTPPPSPST